MSGFDRVRFARPEPERRRGSGSWISLIGQRTSPNHVSLSPQAEKAPFGLRCHRAQPSVLQPHTGHKSAAGSVLTIPPAPHDRSPLCGLSASQAPPIAHGRRRDSRARAPFIPTMRRVLHRPGSIESTPPPPELCPQDITAASAPCSKSRRVCRGLSADSRAQGGAPHRPACGTRRRLRNEQDRGHDRPINGLSQRASSSSRCGSRGR